MLSPPIPSLHIAFSLAALMLSLSQTLNSCFSDPPPFPLEPNHFPFLLSPDPSCFALEIRSSNAILCEQPCSFVFKQRTSLLPLHCNHHHPFIAFFRPIPTPRPSLILTPLHSKVCSPLCVFFGVLNTYLFFKQFPRLTLPLRLSLSITPPHYIF